MKMQHQLEKPVDVLVVEDSKVQASLMTRVLAEVQSLQLLDIVEDGVEAMAYLRREGRYQDAKPVKLKDLEHILEHFAHYWVRAELPPLD
jgi:CheY-like chemotaxis protein